MQVLSELRRGLARTIPYLLSHHPPEEFARCYTLPVRDRRIQVCARCLGIYPGILAGVLAGLIGPFPVDALVWVFLLPAPALLEWTITADDRPGGSNLIRTGTGLLLGYAYGIGLVSLLIDHQPLVLLAGIGYGGAAAYLIFRRRERLGL